MFTLNLYFWDEGHLYVNCLFYTLSLCLKCVLFFIFKSWHMYTHAHFNRGLKWMQKSPKKQSHFTEKYCLWNFSSEMKVVFMPIASFIFSLFILNAFFLSSLVVAYVMMIYGAGRGSTAPFYCSRVYFTSQPFVLNGLIPYVSPCTCEICGFPWQFLLFSHLH